MSEGLLNGVELCRGEGDRRPERVVEGVKLCCTLPLVNRLPEGAGVPEVATEGLTAGVKLFWGLADPAEEAVSDSMAAPLLEAARERLAAGVKLFWGLSDPAEEAVSDWVELEDTEAEPVAVATGLPVASGVPEGGPVLEAARERLAAPVALF